MARKKKYPKAPKKTASLSVWENHRAKCKEVDAFNAKIESDKKKKESLIKAVNASKSKRK